MVIVRLFKSMLKGFLLDLPTPVNINFWYGLGSILGVIYTIQITRGLVLSWFYHVEREGGFRRVVVVIQDVYGG